MSKLGTLTPGEEARLRNLEAETRLETKLPYYISSPLCRGTHPSSKDQPLLLPSDTCLPGFPQLWANSSPGAEPPGAEGPGPEAGAHLHLQDTARAPPFRDPGTSPDSSSPPEAHRDGDANAHPDLTLTGS
ncbi:hypothetical protein VULLAG_LOCUS20344 [Vulpes lagopus]